MKTKLTPWIPGNIRPVRDGVYQRQYGGSGKNIMYARYHADLWYLPASTPQAALRVRMLSARQVNKNPAPWRGIAK